MFVNVLKRIIVHFGRLNALKRRQQYATVREK